MTISIDFKRYKREITGAFVALLILIGGVSLFRYASSGSGFEIVDDLGGNIFPSAILSVATTDAQVIVPSDSVYVGNPKSCVAVRLKSRKAYTRVRVEVAGTPFFSRSVSEFVLDRARTEYTVYPDIIWNYEALRNNVQAEPVSVAVTVEVNGEEMGRRCGRFPCAASTSACWVRCQRNRLSRHEPFLCRVRERGKPADRRIASRGAQYAHRHPFSRLPEQSFRAVDKQVYALWNVLQKRRFRYSSVSNTSLSSNVVYSQRVRTFDDALQSSQVNCVDGSVLLASLLRAINIDPHSGAYAGTHVRGLLHR